MRTVAALFGLGMLACDGANWSQRVSFEPHSMRMNGTPIAATAVRIGPGDVGAIRSAGGLPYGTLVMRGETMSEIDEAAAREAADLGGTHYMLGDWGTETTTHGYVGKSAGSSWYVVPITSSEKHARYVVIRVPRSGWHRLSAEMTPVSR